MASWRLLIPDQTVRRLDILPGKPNVLAAWTQTERLFCFDLQNGARLSERKFDDAPTNDRQSDRWRAFTATLTAPNSVPLPYVRAGAATIHHTDDGRMRLLDLKGKLFMDVDSKEAQLPVDKGVRFTTIALDRALGLVAALDERGRLHIYQQHLRVGVFDVGLTPDDEARPMLTLSHGGATVFVTDGHQLVVVDSNGRARKRLALHYSMGDFACSPDGRLLAVTEPEIGVIRVYNGATLAPTHQRFASDMLTEARRVQLMADPHNSFAALGPLAITNRGALAFALSGGLCVSSVTKMSALPKSS
jgi:hypothetical protein